MRRHLKGMRFFTSSREVLPRLLAAVAGLILLLLSGCTAPETPFATTVRPVDAKYLSAVPAGRTDYSNESLADVFTILTHDLEGGPSRPNLVRFERPVRVAMIGEGSAPYQLFLAEFVRRARAETGIDIAIGPPDTANLLVRFVPNLDFVGVSNAQCIVVDGHPTWEELLEDVTRDGVDPFGNFGRRNKATALIPSLIEPFKIRECILEELTQALGTANDLYALGDTIFNDDNAHTWPTRLDFLMLKVLYDPRLRTGMNRQETRSRALTILNDLNPEGTDPRAERLPRMLQQTFLNWRNRLHEMIASEDLSTADQIGIVTSLNADAKRVAPNSGYHCHAAMLEADVVLHLDYEKALPRIASARDICARAYGAEDIRLARLGLMEAAVHLRARRPLAALKAADGLDAVFLSHGKEMELLDALETLILAHALAGNLDEHEHLIDSLRAWAAYSLGVGNRFVERLSRL